MALPSPPGGSPRPGYRFWPRDSGLEAGHDADMSFVDAPSRWSMLAHNSADNLPRLALIAAVVMARVTTLAGPPAPGNIRPPIPPADAGRPGYPLRVDLPVSKPVALDEKQGRAALQQRM